MKIWDGRNVVREFCKEGTKEEVIDGFVCDFHKHIENYCKKNYYNHKEIIVSYVVNNDIEKKDLIKATKFLDYYLTEWENNSKTFIRVS